MRFGSDTPCVVFFLPCSCLSHLSHSCLFLLNRVSLFFCQLKWGSIEELMLVMWLDLIVLLHQVLLPFCSLVVLYYCGFFVASAGTSACNAPAAWATLALLTFFPWHKGELIIFFVLNVFEMNILVQNNVRIQYSYSFPWYWSIFIKYFSLQDFQHDSNVIHVYSSLFPYASLQYFIYTVITRCCYMARILHCGLGHSVSFLRRI